MYGQTEANSSTCFWIEQLPADERTPMPIGRSLPNFEVFALDSEGKEVTKPRQEGEFYVRASSVAAGYWDKTEKTEKTFVKDPLRPYMSERVDKTGDLV
jgi:non-ribosomal peptide synthetase component F